MNTLPIGSGQTYTELQAYRKAHTKHKEGLVRSAFQLLQDLEGGVDIHSLADINDVSLELHALDPSWEPFSVACFTAYHMHFICGAVTVYGAMKAAFDSCVAALTSSIQKCA